MDKIAVIGHGGMLGAALVRCLRTAGMTPWLPDDHVTRTLNAEVALAGMDIAFVAAGVGGGIAKNLRVPSDLAYRTLTLLAAVLEGARRAGVSRLIWFGCACVYPRSSGGVLTPEDLWTGPLEPTSQAFAAAQLAGIELTRAMNQQYGTEYLCIVCPTLYGPGDDFSEDGHVVAALMRRLHEARKAGAAEVALWGTGRAWRQVCYVDDVARAAIMVAQAAWFKTVCPLMNLGGDRAMMVAGLAAAVAKVVGYEGDLRWTGHGPEGAPSKDVASGVGLLVPTPLETGLRNMYQWFLAHAAHLRAGTS